MNVYEIITNQIISNLEKGIILWKKPFTSASPKNYVTENNYKGINYFLLSSSNFLNPFFLTFKQIQDLGGSVKKGEKGFIVIFYKSLEIETDKEKNKTVPMLKYYYVWNWEQTTGIQEKTIDTKNNNPISECEKIINDIKYKPVIKQGLKACYIPSIDTIQIPDLKYFDSESSYYSVLFHELTHWTGHEKRLNRDGIKTIAFGSECYSKEELIAELGASFLCSFTGILQQTITNSTAYIQNWLQVLKNDSRFIIQASSQAQKAIDFILGVSKDE